MCPWRKKPMSVMSAKRRPPHPAPASRLGGVASGKRAITEKSTPVPATLPGRFIPNQKKAAERFFVRKYWKTGWWFQTFFIFTPIGEDSHFD